MGKAKKKPKRKSVKRRAAPEKRRGRPPIFETAEQMQQAVDAYFKTKPDPPTICGLALALGLATRGSLLNYQARKQFQEVVERAKLRVEQHHEACLSRSNCTGSIFWLKNFGWKDTQDINHGGSVRIILEDDKDA